MLDDFGGFDGGGAGAAFGGVVGGLLCERGGDGATIYLGALGFILADVFAHSFFVQTKLTGDAAEGAALDAEEDYLLLLVEGDHSGFVGLHGLQLPGNHTTASHSEVGRTRIVWEP